MNQNWLEQGNYKKIQHTWTITIHNINTFQQIICDRTILVITAVSLLEYNFTILFDGFCGTPVLIVPITSWLSSQPFVYRSTNVAIYIAGQAFHYFKHGHFLANNHMNILDSQVDTLIHIIWSTGVFHKWGLPK